MNRRSVCNFFVALTAVALLLYVVSWMVMPFLGSAYELNFDHRCDAGAFSLIDTERSTCSSGGPGVVGFPLAVHPGPFFDNVLTIVIDAAPAVVLGVVIRLLRRRL